jgi:hypothetical protein
MPTPAPELPQAAPEPAEPPKPREMLRVVKGGQVGVGGGCITWLHKGATVDPCSFGPALIESLKCQGIEFESFLLDA